MIDFSKKRAEQVLKKASLDMYNKKIAFFSDQLSILNVNIFILKKVLQFPFEIFVSLGENVFFSWVVRNFYEHSVLVISRLFIDEGGDVFTLPRFKNWVFSHMKSQYLSGYKMRLKSLKLDSKTREVRDKVKDLRKKIVVHINREIALGMDSVRNVSVEELEGLVEKLNSILDAVAFDVEYEMFPLPYIDTVIYPEGSTHSKDIDAILDSIAKNSSLLNMPEENPTGWQITKESLDDEYLKKNNTYRKKFGLREA